MSRPVTVDISGLDGDRQLELSHSIHGDVRMAVTSADTIHEYRMSHGGNVRMFAAVLGYVSRMAYDDESIGQMVGPSLEEAGILAEFPRNPLRSTLTLPPRGVENGGRMRAADLHELGWFALGLPVVAEPGVREEGGTGFYTAHPHGGRVAFVVARTLSESATNQERMATATFMEVADIPPVTQALAQFAMGEYRQDMAGVFWRRLPTYGSS